MKILLCGGSFNDGEGKSSGVVRKVHEELCAKYSDNDITYLNGGNIKDLWSVFAPEEYDVMLWWPDIPNDKVKIADTIKQQNSKVILVTSKRNNIQDDGSWEYSFPYLVNHALGLKSNLFVTFEASVFEPRDKKVITFALYDPLGNTYCLSTPNIKKLVGAMMDRIQFLRNDVTRESIKQCYTLEGVEVPDEVEFFEYIKECAETFQSLIKPPAEVTRFLGNSSFRCDKGFPSFRNGNSIFVSKRNIDKKFIDKKGFVKVYKSDGQYVFQSIIDKPSVDTPIQLRLYEFFSNINYMIHGHVYVKDEPSTGLVYPCGAVEEVREIISALNGRYGLLSFAVNLRGHGCLIGGATVDDLKGYDFVARPVPEYCS